jgi:hypothetical protein
MRQSEAVPPVNLRGASRRWLPVIFAAGTPPDALDSGHAGARRGDCVRDVLVGFVARDVSRVRSKSESGTIQMVGST